MLINEIKPNPNNPRLIKDNKFKQLVKSIQDFPQMLELRPIVIDENNMVLGGNMRLKACIEAGLTDVPVLHANNLSEEKKKEFIVKDNVGYGEWDWDDLANNWNVEELTEWGLDIPNWSAGHEVNTMTDNDIDIEEEFNPMGKMDGKQRVVFLFDGPEEAESYMKSLNVEYKKMNMAWQVNMTTQSI
jgi:hypothetical protein